MGTVFRPITFPRWRVRFVFQSSDGPVLAEGLWWGTQREAELHAIFFLDGLGPRDGSMLYDMECQPQETPNE